MESLFWVCVCVCVCVLGGGVWWEIVVVDGRHM